MPVCNICGETILDGSRTCAVCGSSVEDFVPSAMALPELSVGSSPELPAELPQGVKHCPVCAQVYGADYADAFCSCGTELVDPLPFAPLLDELPFAPLLDEEELVLEVVEEPAVKLRNVKPSSGTPCLVLYGPDKQPLQYFALTKDAMVIGRLDAVAGNFPDVDLDEWFDRATIRRISRQHALILRTRATNTFVLRPLPGNTGTQLEAQMLAAQQDYPLRHGHRIILGAVIRLKFEIA